MRLFRTICEPLRRSLTAAMYTLSVPLQVPSRPLGRGRHFSDELPFLVISSYSENPSMDRRRLVKLPTPSWRHQNLGLASAFRRSPFVLLQIFARRNMSSAPGTLCAAARLNHFAAWL